MYKHFSSSVSESLMDFTSINYLPVGLNCLEQNTSYSFIHDQECQELVKIRRAQEYLQTNRNTRLQQTANKELAKSTTVTLRKRRSETFKLLHTTRVVQLVSFIWWNYLLAQFVESVFKFRNTKGNLSCVHVLQKNVKFHLVLVEKTVKKRIKIYDAQTEHSYLRDWLWMKPCH